MSRKDKYHIVKKKYIKISNWTHHITVMSSPRLPPPPPLLPLLSSVWSVLPSFPQAAHPPRLSNKPSLVTTLLSSPHGKNTSHRLNPRRKCQPEWHGQTNVCVCELIYCTVYRRTHGREGERERKRGERERGKPLCLSWHWANHLPLRAMAGTNLLKVICNHCGWKGLPHQWAFVRHFISKFRGRKKKNPIQEIFALIFIFWAGNLPTLSFDFGE